MVVEGAKVLNEAFDSERRVVAVFAAAGTVDLVLSRAEAALVPVFTLADGVLDRIADTVTPQGIAAIVEWSPATLSSLQDGLAQGGFVVVGVDVRDPGNAGTLIRSAEAAGATGVVLAGSSVDVTSPKVIRASAGSVFHLPVVVESGVTDAVSLLRSWGVRVWATAVRTGATVNYDAADLTGPTAIVVGNEAHGLDEELVVADGLVTIPMRGRTESLNVGVAASILAFESARQRRAGRADSSQ